MRAFCMNVLRWIACGVGVQVLGLGAPFCAFLLSKLQAHNRRDWRFQEIH